MTEDLDLYERFLLNGGRKNADRYMFVKPIEKISADHYKIEFYVHGLRFFTENFSENDSFDQIELKTEPDNKADPDAIAVLNQQKQIGYVPAYFALHLKDYLEEIKLEEVVPSKEDNGKIRLQLKYTLEVDSKKFDREIPEIVEKV